MENQFSFIVKLLIYVGTPLVLAVSLFLYLYTIFFEPVDKNASDSTLVMVEPSMEFRDVSAMLEEKEVIRTSRSLNLFAKLKGLSSPIKPGEYVLSPSMTPKQILETLSAGRVFERSVRVEDGSSVWGIGAVLEEAGIIEKSEFDPWLTNPELLARTGISAGSFEGYFSPGLYEFSRPITAERIIWSMVERAEKEWPADFSQRANQFRLSRHDVLTLASMIEKETEDSGERRLVSSVFHNRLQHEMRLDSDATVMYGLKDFEGELTDSDRSSPSPYNTYINFGLPPGPICNPGSDSVAAALYPEETSYLFFLRGMAGELLFAETQREFEELKAQQNSLIGEAGGDKALPGEPPVEEAVTTPPTAQSAEQKP